jgi:hypothetical protein
MTTLKIPVRTVYDGSNNPIGLAEFQVGEVVPTTHGGTSANTVAQARINLLVDDANIRSLFSVIGSGTYNNTTGVITVTGGVESVGGATGNVSNASLKASIENSGFLTLSNLTVSGEVSGNYFTGDGGNLTGILSGVGFTNSTVYDFPGSSGNFNYGSGETFIGENQTLDAFGVSLITIFDSMEPFGKQIGEDTTTDLGVLT